MRGHRHRAPGSAGQFATEQALSHERAGAIRDHDEQQHGQHDGHGLGVLEVLDREYELQADSARADDAQNGGLPDTRLELALVDSTMV